MLLLFYVVRRLSESPGQIKPPAISSAGEPPTTGGRGGDGSDGGGDGGNWGSGNSGGSGGRSLYLRFAAMLVLVLFSCYGVARAYVHAHSDGYASQMRSDQNAHQVSFPLASAATPCRVHGTRTCSPGRSFITGHSTCRPTSGGTPVSIGISPVLGSHDTLVCHSARGEDPLWRDQITLLTAGNVTVNFSGSLFQRWRNAVSGGDHHLQRGIVRRVLE